MSWVMLATPFHRQTGQHSAPNRLPRLRSPRRRTAAAQLDDAQRQGPRPCAALWPNARGEVEGEGEAAPNLARKVPPAPRWARMSCAIELVGRLTRKVTFENLPWKDAQENGIIWAPVRKPHENAADEHWRARGTFAEVFHPELGRTLTYPVRSGPRPTGLDRGPSAPTLGADTDGQGRAPWPTPTPPGTGAGKSPEPLFTRPRAELRIPRKAMGAGGRPHLRFQLVPRLGRRHPVPHRARRRVHQGGVEGQPRHPDGGDGAGRRTRGPRSGDRPAAGCHRSRHGRPVQQQERRQAGHLAQRPAPRGAGDRQAADRDVRHRGRGVLPRRDRPLGAGL